MIVGGDGVVAGSGCTQDSPTQASCPEVFIRGIFVKFGFANDTVVSEYNGPAGVGVDGNAGDDSIDVRQGNSVEGSSGNDTIVLRGGSGLISGGPGNDTITVASGGRIPTPSGDDGNDTMSGQRLRRGRHLLRRQRQ